ncbi:MAG: D-aminoacylase [Actinobacteria bacterium]|nr:D-aminoacylase [Actinomycetota bacterium]
MTTPDLVIANGRIVDGCGNPWYYGDVAVRGDRIAAIGAAGALRGRAVVDAGGRYVAPGFVDPHTHSDISILQHPRADSVVRQGVTTHVTGNCGMSPAPLSAAHRDEALHNWAHYWDISGVAWDWTSFRQYLKALELAGGAINIAPLVGHGALRLAVMGLADRPATAKELARMERLLDAALRAGAHGLSTGLVYPPGCYAGTDELVRLCRVVGRYQAMYTTHIRGERETILEAVAEALAIGRECGVAVEVSHNAPKWGAREDAGANLALIEEARRDGLDVTTDNDVHTDLAPRLSRALPQPVLDLGHEALMALLGDPRERDDLRRAIADDVLPGAGYTGLVRHGRFERIVILHAGRHPELRGRSVADIAADRGSAPLDTYLDLIVEEDDQIVGIFDYVDERDIRALLRSPLAMVSSDGLVMPPVETLDDPALYWPCSYGEYPGVLERYVRDEPVLRLEEAIRKMTSFPAQRFGLLDRGVLRPGLRADVVVFDLDKVRDRATNLYPHAYPFENIPHRHPEGLDWVLVNGEPVIAEGEHTGALPGRVLRRR